MPLDKPAQTSVAVNKLIAERWSPRSFQDTPVGRDVLVSLFEAARWAPSCNNSQPWRFIIATNDDKAAHEAAVACLNDRNQRWAASAPVVGFMCAHKLMANGNPSPTHTYDAGMAMAQLLVQATEHGLRVHQMAGILKDKIVETFEVPDDTDVVCGFVIGFQADPEALPEDLATREREERVRKPLSDIVFTGKYGTASPIVG